MNDVRRIAILAEGQLAPRTAKTAIGVLRYAPYQVVAVVDSTRAGTDVASHVGVGRGVPVVATVDEARALGAEVLLVGTAAPGGRIADAFRPHLARALESGLGVWSGLHERVLSDPALAAAARRGGGAVRELRDVPADLPIGGHRRPREGARVILTVGTDAAVGKMTVALELVSALERMGERAAFVPTGQTGIAVAGWGISVDAVVADFIAGAAERMVCEAAERADWVVVEGQGSLSHPGFSGVTLGLLHGASPDMMVLVHDASRQVLKGFESEGLPVPALGQAIRMYEEAASWRHPPDRPRARVVAVALNTSGVPEDAVSAVLRSAAAQTRVTAGDPIREGAPGADRLARALLDPAARET